MLIQIHLTNWYSAGRHPFAYNLQCIHQLSVAVSGIRIGDVTIYGLLLINDAVILAESSHKNQDKIENWYAKGRYHECGKVLYCCACWKKMSCYISSVTTTVMCIFACQWLSIWTWMQLWGIVMRRKPMLPLDTIIINNSQAYISSDQSSQ